MKIPIVASNYSVLPVTPASVQRWKAFFKNDFEGVDMEVVQIRLDLAGREISAQWDPRLTLVLGRQETEAEQLGTIHRCDGHLRLAIVPYGAIGVSRRQLQLGSRADGRTTVKNLSSTNPVKVGDLPLGVDNNGELAVVLPVSVEVGGCRVVLEGTTHTLSEPTRFVGNLTTKPEFRTVANFSMLDTEGTHDLVAFLSRVASVLQLASDEQDLCEKACEAVRQLIDVDGVAILRAGTWETVAGSPDIRPRHGALERILVDRRVLWKESMSNAADNTSPSLECYVVSPIVTQSHSEEQIYGVLYAQRQRGTVGGRTRFTQLHARLIELVACNLAAGLVRVNQKQMVGRFEQFFTPALARRIEQGPDLLHAARRDVSVLFCDIRGFSAVCESVGPERTSAWVEDVLSVLSECVQKHDGVLVDYVGDELMAMWGAPEEQPDHADRACRAALAMINEIPGLSARYEGEIGAATSVGIGINSGPATVGNTGSRQRFKYGPLGDTVNRASRVQGLTKYMKVPILISGQTKERLEGEFLLRRLGNAKAVNMEKAIELYELVGESDQGTARPVEFEQAIVELERGNLEQAAMLLSPLLDFSHPDHPSLLAFGEIIDRMLEGKLGENHHWDFGAK